MQTPINYILIVILGFVLLLVGGNAQSLSQLPEVGKSAEIELKGGEVHSYHVTLSADHFLSLTAVQKGIDVVLKLQRPDGTLALEIDSPNGANGPEPLWFVSESAGQFVVQVASLDPKANAGKYELQVNQISEADPDLRSFAAASNLVIEGVNAIVTKKPGADAIATSKFDEAARLYNSIERNMDAKAGGLLRLGRAYKAQKKNELALGFFLRAIEIYESAGKWNEVVAALIDAPLQDASNMGRLKHHLRVLEAAQKAGDKRFEALARNEVAFAYHDLGDFSAAIEEIKRALNLALEINLTSRIPGFYDNMGNIYTALNDYPRAIDAHTKALESYQQAGKASPSTMLNLGNAYFGLGSYELALNNFRLALTEFQKRKAPVGEAYAISNMGNVYLEMGEHDKALDHFLLAQPLKAKFLPKDPTTYYNLAAVYFAKNRHSEAIDSARKALELSKSLQDRNGVTLSHIHLARGYMAAGDRKNAKENLSLAAALAKEAQYRNLEWQIFYLQAQLFHAEGAKPESVQALRSATALLDGLRTQAALDEDTEEAFSRDKIAPYRMLAMVQAEMGRSNDALEAAEASRARALLQTIGNGRVSIVKNLSTDERTNERKMRQELVSLQIELSNANDETSRALIESRLAAKRLEFEALKLALYATHPELRTQRGEMKPIQLTEASALLKGTSGGLIEYVVAEDKTLLLAITMKGAIPDLKIYTINIRRDDLITKTEEYRKKLAAGDLDFAKGSRQLYDLLLKPAAAQLNGRKELVIVPDDVLWDLPFQTLQNPTGKYLVETAALSYAPSFTALREMRKLSASHRRGNKLLAFGNPAMKPKTNGSAPRFTMSEDLEPLPEAERLVNALKQMYGPERSRVFTGEEATEGRAKSEIPDFNVVQFATHGILNNTSPMYSQIVLSRADDDFQDEDGLLEAWELKELDFGADIVILSACETARGKLSAGEGLVGMTWASFIAGSPTTVASQWKVESSSTNELMLEFHRQLLSKKRPAKAEALRRASLKMLRTPKYAHPSYWAGFVIVGDAS